MCVVIVVSSLAHHIDRNRRNLTLRDVVWSREEPIRLHDHILKLIPSPSLCFPPNVFRQANIASFAAIIRKIRRFLPAKARCIELYGGVGTIGLNCLDLVSELQCSDENPYNAICFNKTLDMMRCETSFMSRDTDELLSSSGSINADNKRKLFKRYKRLSTKASYRTSSAALRANDLCEFDVAIVDPPRKGLDVEIIDCLREMTFSDSNSDDETNKQLLREESNDRHSRLNRFIYVSCGFKGFTHDCERILSIDRSGQSKAFNGSISDIGGRKSYWKLVHVEGHVLFPGSDHIETLAVFDRIAWR